MEYIRDVQNRDLNSFILLKPVTSRSSWIRTMIQDGKQSNPHLACLATVMNPIGPQHCGAVPAYQKSDSLEKGQVSQVI